MRVHYTCHDIEILLYLGKNTKTCHWLFGKGKKNVSSLSQVIADFFFFSAIKINSWLCKDQRCTHTLKKKMSGSVKLSVRAKLACLKCSFRSLHFPPVEEPSSLFFFSRRQACRYVSLSLCGQLLFDQLAVLREATFDASHRAVTAHPQFLAHHLDEPLVVGHQHHTALKPV